MKQTLTRVVNLAALFIFLLAVLSSCVPQKKIKYLQKQQENDTTSLHANKRTNEYKVQPNDNLYIRVFALDEKAYTFFNKQSGTGYYSDYSTDAAIYLNSYSVSPEGAIDFPIVGKVDVKDLTVEQIKTILQQFLSEYLKEITVVVKIVNFKVTIVGEVSRPGEYSIYKDDMNLFEAIALAGDLGEFANRNKVAIIRATKGGSQVHYIDLTSDKILSSQFYYLQPNDIIYISPLGYKRWGLGSTFPWAIILASVSTTLLLINYFK